MKYDAIARLFEYPADDYKVNVARGGEDLADFAATIEPLSITALQELFVQTFDWNPDTCLSLGWHLFGENYDRGESLVRLRQEMQRYGVPETGELPDHLMYVLPVLGRMEPERSGKFAAEFLLPALKKLRKGLQGSPFDELARVVESRVETDFNLSREKIRPASEEQLKVIYD